MGKIYAAGYNATGQLGVGDVISHHTTLTEVEYADKQLIKLLSKSYNADFVLFGLFDDGYIYYVGGSTSGNKNEWTLFDNTRKYIDGDVLRKRDGVTQSITTVSLVLVGDDGQLYKAVGVPDTSTGQMLYTVTVTAFPNDGTFGWNALRIKLVSQVNNYWMMIATDTHVYIVRATTLTSPTQMYEANVKFILAAPAQPRYCFYYIDSNNDLYAWGAESGVDTYGMITPDGGSIPLVPTLFASDVKEFKRAYMFAALLSTTNNLTVFGWQSQKYYNIMPDIGIYDGNMLYNVMVSSAIPGVEKFDIFSTTAGSDKYHVTYVKNDGSVYSIGRNEFGMLGTGTTANSTQWTAVLGDFTGYSVFGNYYGLYLTSPTDVRINVTIWDNSRTTEIAEITDIPEVSRISLGQYFPVLAVLTDIENNPHELSIPYSTNRQFLGLTTEPGSSTVVYAAGETNDVSWPNNINLYIVLGEIPPGVGFTISCYNLSAEDSRVDKTEYMSPVTSLVGTLREASSIVSPSITFQFNGVPRWNYVYISVFHRYYYVSDIVSVNNNLWSMSLSCDPLMSFKTGILALENAIVGRTANLSEVNPLIDDDYMCYSEEVDIDVIESATTPFSVTSDSDKCMLLNITDYDIKLGLTVPRATKSTVYLTPGETLNAEDLLTYNHEYIEILSGSAPTTITAAGEYNYYFGVIREEQRNSGAEWSNGRPLTETITVKITVIETAPVVAIPKVTGSPLSFAYDGQPHIPTFTNYNVREVQGVDVVEQTQIGNYTSWFVPKTGYVWSDLTKDAVVIDWSIV